MNRLDLSLRVRSLTRDFSNAIFREADVHDYINEGINRTKQLIPQLRDMKPLTTGLQEVEHLPVEYHHLLAVYCASRCFAQDGQNYQASTLMNEFEQKFDGLKQDIENGEIIIKDKNGNEVTHTYKVDYVHNNYFLTKANLVDVDEGVEGV